MVPAWICGIEVGTALVRHPLIRAVAFTGSLRAGRALFDLAAAKARLTLDLRGVARLHARAVSPESRTVCHRCLISCAER